MRELHLFAGGGGGIYGGMLLRHTPVCAVELKPYRRKVLLQRQRDSIMPRFPIWDDVRTFDGKPWRGIVDVVCGGFPCTDISCAGKGAGINGKHSGLWKQMLRVVCEVGPEYVFVENSPMLLVRGLGTVLGDLAECGYDAAWDLFSCAELGAPHIRQRIFILAHSERNEWMARGWRVDHAESLESPNRGVECHDTPSLQFKKSPIPTDADDLRQLQQEGIKSDQRRRSLHCDWWKTEPGMGRVVHGVANRVERSKALGDGQVPAVAAMAFELLSKP